MKNPMTFFCFVCFASVFMTLTAQESATVAEVVPSDYLNRSPIYDYSERQLNNTDTIPEFTTQENKLLLTGTIFQSDGVTPAKDVVLYISQPDEDGDYELKKLNDKRYIVHRGWIKTDADGKYAFYTFIPGNFWRNREVKHIHPVIKAPGKPEQEMAAFLFDNDQFLSKSCRKRLAKRGIDNILTVEKNETMFVTTKDIILAQDTPENK